jgi:hypothetical protein
MSTLADRIINFNHSLHLPDAPNDIVVMNPYRDPDTRHYSDLFYQKFYGDNRKRIYMAGINPGRNGAGITGVCFVDPIKLENECGISNPFPKKPELSSDFIFMMIKAFGGVDEFFSKFLLTALCPLGFMKNGKNINYYDEKPLMTYTLPFIVEKMHEQIGFGTVREVCFCIGEGTNYKIFSKLNAEHGFFSHIIPLPHPRFVLQYRRKRLEEYISIYTDRLREAEKYL